MVDEKETKDAERMEEEASKLMGEELLLLDSRWERSKAAVRRGKQTSSLAGKRGNNTTKEQRAPKMMRYVLINNWGERKDDKLEDIRRGSILENDDLETQPAPSGELNQNDIRHYYTPSQKHMLPEPTSLPLAPQSQNNSPETPGSPVTQVSVNTDDNSQSKESIAQGFPPV